MPENLLEVERLTKTYFPDRKEPLTALKELTFSVADGELLSLVGPSGCGKSTFINLACGIAQPTSGEIRLRGEPITAPIGDVGIAFQAPILLEWRTVLQNVLLPIEILERRINASHREHACSLLKLVGLAGFEDAFPQELSGGMQQRVSICRALIHNPSFLLMDEPFGALDAMTRDRMNLELLRIWGQARKTLIFITHSIVEAVFLSDRVVVLTGRPGRVRDIVRIDAPRPRDPTSADFRKIEVHIRGLIGESVEDTDQ
jgi:NitT/TauT family transport system ATP-binding protein